MKKAVLIFLIFLSLSYYESFAQNKASYDWMYDGLGFTRTDGLHNVISKLDSEGNLINAGSYYGFTDYSFVHKISPTGELICRIDSRFEPRSEGKILDLIVDAENNIYAAGYYFTAFPPTEIDTLFVKKIVNSENAFQTDWEYRHLMGDAITFNFQKDDIRLIKNDSDIIVTGITLNRDLLGDIVTIKLDTNGNEVWKKYFTNGENYDVSPKDLATDNGGNVFIYGNSVKDDSTTAQLIKYSSEGDLLWDKTIINPDNLSILAVDVEISKGSTWISAKSAGVTLLNKYNLLGDLVKEIRGESYGANLGLSIDAAKNVYQINNDSIFKYNPAGDFISSVGLPNIAYHFNVDTDQNIFVVGKRTHFYTAKINKNLEVEAAFETIWQDPPNQHYSSSIPYDVTTSLTSEVFISGLVNIYDSINFNSHSAMISLKYTQLPTNVKKSELNQNSFYLFQNYPNPFNPSTKIEYTIPSNKKRETSNVRLIIYDVLGKEVTTLVNKEQTAGSYEVEFNGNGLSSGIYFYRLRTGRFVETKKMVLLR